jgi:hypothetical protein
MILRTMEDHCYAECHIACKPFMLSAIMLNVVMLSVNILSFVAPRNTGELLLYPQILDVGRKVCQSNTLPY